MNFEEEYLIEFEKWFKSKPQYHREALGSKMLEGIKNGLLETSIEIDVKNKNEKDKNFEQSKHFITKLTKEIPELDITVNYLISTLTSVVLKVKEKTEEEKHLEEQLKNPIYRAYESYETQGWMPESETVIFYRYNGNWISYEEDEKMFRLGFCINDDNPTSNVYLNDCSKAYEEIKKMFNEVMKKYDMEEIK